MKTYKDYFRGSRGITLSVSVDGRTTVGGVFSRLEQAFKDEDLYGIENPEAVESFFARWLADCRASQDLRKPAYPLVEDDAEDVYAYFSIEGV